MVIADETTDWLGRVGGAPLPVLLTLYSGGQMHQAQIARATRLKPQTVREALHVLEIHELVVAFYGDRRATRWWRECGGGGSCRKTAGGCQGPVDGCKLGPEGKG
jgi:hypothetical protein